MTVEQRLDRLDNDLAVVRQLLTSAATYAESANRGLDNLTIAQDRTQAQLDNLTIGQDRTQAHLDQLSITQDRTQAQVDQLSNRVNEFVFHAQRLFTQIGTKLESVEGQSERLEAVVRRLDRNYETQQFQLQEFQRNTQESQASTNAALERIDRILDYLLRQQRNGNGTGEP